MLDRKMRRWVLVSLCTMVAARTAWASDTIIRIGVDAANPPFMFGSLTRAEGLYPALTEKLFAHVGVPVRIEAMPWKRVLRDLESGQAGVAGLYKNAERAAKYVFSDVLYVERIGVYFHANKAVDFMRLDDLKGLRVGVIGGWSYGDEFDQARAARLFQVEEVSSDLKNFAKLEAQRIDVALVVIDAATPLLKLGGFPNARLSPTLLAENPTYIAFAAKTGTRELVRQLNEALAALHRSGVFAQTVGAALGDSSGHPPNAR